MSDTPPLSIRRPIPRRPIPRRPFRPFEIGIVSPASPDTPPLTADSPPPSPRRLYVSDEEHEAQTYLDAQVFNRPVDSSSRAASYQALTSSTLSGIYHQSDVADGYPGSVQEAVADEDAFPDTPSLASMLDEGVYKLMRERRSSMLGGPARRRPSALSAQSGQGLHQPASPQSLGLRTGVLFLLGMGYGAILSRLSTHTEQKWASFPVESMLRPGYDGRYLAAWGLCGVVLGSLLPWFDGKWEEVFEKKGGGGCDDAINDEEVPGTDWALVVRGIGAFAGIVFAIVRSRFIYCFPSQCKCCANKPLQRKLPWASTMQVSLTLAMVNPFLWYLIDRSKPGFLLSAAVGLAAVILTGLNPEIMPTPMGSSSAHLRHNHTGGQRDGEPLMLGGLATQKTIETGLWALSVLFCSCVCFGNIGRRLALNRSAAGRGRWGGLK